MIDDRLFRDTMGKFATGITVVTIEEKGQVFGMTVNAFMSVSLHPKLIAVSIDKSARMFNKIMQADKFGVSILSETQEEYSKFFARQQADLEPIVYKKLDGVSVLEDPIAALSCKRDNSFQAGDHIIVTAEVTDLFVNEKDPVIFFGGQYRSLSESI